MKVLLINDYEELIGGTEFYIQTLKKELESRGHIIKIYSSRKSSREYLISQNSKSINKFLRKMFNFKSYKEVKSIINQFHPDIIHIHNIFNEISPSILLAVNKIPVVMTVHDNLLINAVSILSGRTGKDCKTRVCHGCSNCIGIKGAIYEYIKNIIHKILFEKISLYITPSIYMKKLVQEAGYNPVRHIDNGFKLFKYSKINKQNNILYVGRLNNEKGVEYLLRAMPRVVERNPKIKLTIIGDGNEKGNLMLLAQNLKIKSNVFFLNTITQDRLEEYYKNSTIVIVPSIYNDNFPTVIIEAMSIGRPVIGTRMGGIPELIDNGKTGFLVKSKSYKSLEEKILYLQHNKKVINILSRNAHEKSKLYHLKNHANKIESIYKKLINYN
jgi:glycosyltransferase involved in cell wall biosynthesis